MTEKEFNLSEKILPRNNAEPYKCIPKEDVKEFIKRITDDIYVQHGEAPEIALIRRIKKLSGDKLI